MLGYMLHTAAQPHVQVVYIYMIISKRSSVVAMSPTFRIYRTHSPTHSLTEVPYNTRCSSVLFYFLDVYYNHAAIEDDSVGTSTIPTRRPDQPAGGPGRAGGGARIGVSGAAASDRATGTAFVQVSPAPSLTSWTHVYIYVSKIPLRE